MLVTMILSTFVMANVKITNINIENPMKIVPLFVVILSEHLSTISIPKMYKAQPEDMPMTIKLG